MRSRVSRRRFLATSAALSLAGGSFLRAAAAPGSSRIFIGTGNRGPGSGILSASWNAKTGEIGETALAAEVDSPTFLATFRRPNGETLLYSISEASGAGARVSAFRVVPGTGRLLLLNQVPSGGDGPAHVSVSPDGRSVFAANYGGGSVSSFHIQADGSLSPAVSNIQFTGSGPYKGRQDKPHTHSAVCSPDGRYLFVNELGLDRIFLFHRDPATSKVTPNDPPFWSSRPGAGPRHIAWNRDGRFVYGSNELDSTVDTLQWEEGAGSASLRTLQTRSSLPEGFAPNTAFVGEILTSADGRNVYAGNRVADDTVAIFDIDRSTGLLSAPRFAPSGGKNSRHVALDPTDRWMVISHQTSSDLTVLERDPRTGALSAPRRSYPVNKPMCVVFV